MKLFENSTRYFFALFAIFIGLTATAPSYAHPMDNTDTYIQVKKDYDDTDINANSLKIYSYISWYIAGDIYFKKTGNITTDFEELLTFNKDYSKYVYDRLIINNNGAPCVGEITYSPQNDSLSMGALVTIQYQCPNAIENLEIKNTIAHDIFELPTNFMTVQIGSNVLEKISLGNANLIMAFNLPALEKNPIGDVSVDFTANYSADDVISTQIDMLSDMANSQTGTNSEQSSGPKSNSFLSNIADVIFLRANKAKDQPLPILMLFVFLLGLLHTLEAGHSKAVLTSNLLNNKVTFKQSLLYVFVFTATHLGDIVFIGILFLVLNNFYDIFGRLGLFERFAGFAVFFLASYMLVKSITDYIKSKVVTASQRNEHNKRHVKVQSGVHKHTAGSIHEHDHEDPHGHSHNNMDEILKNKNISFKNQIAIGILTGIAPCIFGWSIFMLVVSTGNLWLLFPVILSFGVGIFVALTIVAFLVTRIRSATIGKIGFLADISPIISALFLLIYSIMIII